MKKRLLTAFFVIIIALTLFVITSSASTPVETWDISATSDDNVTAYLYNNHENEGMYTLTISGTGNMLDWNNPNTPWYSSYGPKSITSVTIENGVTNIGYYTFYNCTGLTSITISKGVTTIGSYAFNGCSSLSSITIPDGVTTIGNGAFSGCRNLTSITFPESVTTIENDAFYGCNSLCYNEFDNGFYLGNSDNPYLILVKAKDTAIASCIINERAKLIYCRTFEGCNNLTSITIPEGVTSIGEYAFAGCLALTEINFNATNMSDLSLSSRVFTNAGKNSDGITVTIGKNVTKVPASLFDCDQNYAPNIKSVIFEENSACESIGNYAFFNCSSLTGITIPESVASIGSIAFAGCLALTEINFNATNMSDLSLSSRVFTNAGKNSDITTVTIGKNVTRIPAYLFYESGITSVIFEENSACESIGRYAFANCSSLTSITIPERVSTIGDYAFANCSNLTSITISEGVTIIGNHAFENCFALTKINFNATNMSDLADNSNVFRYAGKSSNGITVTIGKNATKIPAYLFYATDNHPTITSVIFEENSVCESIGNRSFRLCANLTSITIPESVASINNSAFYGCTSLANITVSKDNQSYESLDGNVYTKGGKTLVCYAMGKKDTHFAIPNSVTSIDSYAFYGPQTNLTSIYIPSSVISVGYEAFRLGSNAPHRTLTIYCEAESQPNTWDSNWNSYNYTVVWGYVKLEDIIVFKGYSVREDGASSICVSYTINYDKLAKYEEQTGKTLDFGIVFAGYDNLKGKQPLNNDGTEITLEKGKVIKQSLVGLNYSNYDFVMNNISETIKDTLFVITVYLYDGETVKYCTSNGISDTVSGISYNQIKGE